MRAADPTVPATSFSSTTDLMILAGSLGSPSKLLRGLVELLQVTVLTVSIPGPIIIFQPESAEGAGVRAADPAVPATGFRFLSAAQQTS